MRLMSNDIFWPLGASDVCTATETCEADFPVAVPGSGGSFWLSASRARRLYGSRLGALCIAITGSSELILRDAFGDSSTA